MLSRCSLSLFAVYVSRSVWMVLFDRQGHDFFFPTLRYQQIVRLHLGSADRTKLVGKRFYPNMIGSPLEHPNMPKRVLSATQRFERNGGTEHGA